MRVVVFFDLPTIRDSDKRAYSQFRNNLLKMGFDMIQYSVYSKICTNKQSSDTCVSNLQAIAPQNGSIRALVLTEKQYSNMTIIIGGYTSGETKIKDRRFIVIE